ncbi:MAG: YraN family protein [Desulfobulbaceae bacterium]|nr:YraN family protein [Desulfobulbaceae bacterium]
MTKARVEKGRQGEALAAQYLTRHGYQIIQKNFRVSCGEIDIIAHDKDALVFVEVKTRTGAGFGPPAEAVTCRKRQQISRTALVYLSQRRLLDVSARFDVVSVVLREGAEPQIELIKNAFELAYEG